MVDLQPKKFYMTLVPGRGQGIPQRWPRSRRSRTKMSPDVQGYKTFLPWHNKLERFSPANIYEYDSRTA